MKKGESVTEGRIGETEGAGGDARRVKVLVAVKSPPLFKVIEHLLRNHPELQIVACDIASSTARGAAQAGGLARHAGEELPQLIVASIGLLGRDTCRTIAEVKRSSPRSQLIVLCSTKGFGREARRCGAAAYLDEAALVRRLSATVRRLASLN